jgi:hypothetical protein
MEDIYRFEKHLVGMSESDDLREALAEWIFVNYRLGDKDTKVRCVCGRHVWKEINVYCNELNGNTIHAGSECDKRFKGIQRHGRAKNELLKEFMAMEKGVYENIYDYMAYSRDVLDRLCKHIETQIGAFNLAGLEKLLRGVEGIIAGLVSKKLYKGDLDRFIPMIQATMEALRVKEEAARVQREADRARQEADWARWEADWARQEAARIAKAEAARIAKAEAEQFVKEEKQRKAAIAEAAQLAIKEEQQRKAAVAQAIRMADIQRKAEQAAEKKRLLEIKEKEALAAEEKWRSSDRSDKNAFNEAVAKWAEKQRILTLAQHCIKPS